MVLVTGGTGLVGTHLLLHLLQNNTAVRALHRKESNLDQVQKAFSYYTENAAELFEKIDWVQADLSDIPALDAAFENITHVYHAAAFISFDPNDYKDLMKTNARGTAVIVNLCIAHAVKKLCYVSTIGTIGKSPDGMTATEDNEWTTQNTNVYALSKHAAEMEVWRGSQEGLAVVMVNPGVIIGPGYWKSGSGALFTTANKGYSYYPPGGTGFIVVNDVIRMMVGLMHAPIVNERFIAVAENLTFQDILTRITKQLGKPKPLKKLKIWQLEIGRIADFVWNAFTKNGRKITKDSIHGLKHREIYTNQKIKNALDFEFEPLDDTIQFSCKKFMEQLS